MFVRTMIAALVAGMLATTSHAGDQYIDGTGYAVSGYDVVAYFDLPQSKIGQTQPKAVPGTAGMTAEFNGAKFAFSSQKNLTRFLKDPAKYVPQFDGHCAYGVAVDGKVPGNPDLWRIVDGKLYLNISKDVADKWEKDIPTYLEDAKGYWPELETESASNDPVPDFTPAAPIAN
jgi:YHS domain-containing protein